MKDTVPQYVAPPPDPGLALLTQQNEQDRQAAIEDRVQSASARMMTMYGTRVAMAGQTLATPLLAPAAARGAGGGFGTPTAMPNYGV